MSVGLLGLALVAGLFLTITLLFGMVALVAIRRHRVLHERQWVHDERMTAIEQGAAIPPDWRPGHESVSWPRVALGVSGFLGAFVGFGMLAASQLGPDPNQYAMRPLGLIAVSGGVAMLALFMVMALFRSANDVMRVARKGPSSR